MKLVKSLKVGRGGGDPRLHSRSKAVLRFSPPRYCLSAPCPSYQYERNGKSLGPDMALSPGSALASCATLSWLPTLSDL